MTLEEVASFLEGMAAQILSPSEAHELMRIRACVVRDAADKVAALQADLADEKMSYQRVARVCNENADTVHRLRKELEAAELKIEQMEDEREDGRNE